MIPHITYKYKIDSIQNNQASFESNFWFGSSELVRIEFFVSVRSSGEHA